MKEELLTIRAADGYPLTATLREPRCSPKAFVQINSGTGIPQRFYRHFAAYLTDLGYVTVTFDYRGIGASKPTRLKNFEATTLQWGTLDMTAVLDWGLEQYPDLSKIVIGHSMGGQLIGTMRNADRIDRTVIIAAGTGFWRDMPQGMLRLFMPVLWYVYIPLTTWLCGYGAARKIRQGENLPRGVARQWRNWCVSSTYWERDFGQEFNSSTFDRLRGSLQSVSFSDDTIISDQANKKLLGYYREASINRQVIDPATVGRDRIGHLGFFRKGSDVLWGQVINH